METSELVDKIEQEDSNKTLVLDNPGQEQDLALEAARVTRGFFSERIGMNYVPAIDEIRQYAVVYSRALELLKSKDK